MFSRAERSQLLVLLIALLLIGCGLRKGNVPPPSDEERHLSALARVYGIYIRTHQGTRPPSVAHLREFVKKMSPAELSLHKIESAQLDSMFVSPRDGKEYVVRILPANAVVPNPSQPSAVVLYEREGVDGKRLVAYEQTSVEEVDAGRFKELVPEGQ